MRLPIGNQLMQFGGRRRGEKTVAQGLIAEHLRQLGKNLQVQVGGAVGHQENENETDVLRVGCIERYRLFRPDKRANRFL
ncbi:hypothetical protein D3C83_13830 [compost metagenome]